MKKIILLFFVVLSIFIVVKYKDKHSNTLRNIARAKQKEAKYEKLYKKITSNVNKKRKIKTKTHIENTILKNEKKNDDDEEMNFSLTEQFKYIIDNFTDLDAPTTENGRIAYQKIKNILSAPPQKSFNKIKQLVNSNTIKTEPQKQFFIQLANRLSITDTEKVDFLENIAEQNFYKENFESEQALYTAEIAFKSTQRSISSQTELKRLNNLKHNIKNERLKNLVAR